MNLFQQGDFTLHSGQSSDFLINCDALSDEDITTCAYLLHQRLPRDFQRVIGIPDGGLRLAKAMRRHQTSGYASRAKALLIVDDVFTTGRSFYDYQAEPARQEGELVLGAVIFARAETPDWIYPLFKMS